MPPHFFFGRQRTGLSRARAGAARYIYYAAAVVGLVWSEEGASQKIKSSKRIKFESKGSIYLYSLVSH